MVGINVEQFIAEGVEGKRTQAPVYKWGCSSICSIQQESAYPGDMQNHDPA